jgi:hypothetical protein
MRPLQLEDGGGNIFKLSKKLVILRGMKTKGLLPPPRRRRLIGLVIALVLMSAGMFYLYGQDKSGFPDGYDAVQAAPDYHKVMFENAFVRILQLKEGPSGTLVPMHHHRWGGFFLNWDTGGKTTHLRFHYPDGKVEDRPSMNEPAHPGVWKVRWTEPDPMRSVEIVDSATPAGGPGERPPQLRIEIKCHP